MKIIIRLYYLLYILSGGFRHFAFEYGFFTNLTESTQNYLEFFYFFENALFLLAIVLFLKPSFKIVHLVFFGSLLSLDIYFNNFIKFESAILASHLFPLIAFLAFSKYSKKSIQLFSILLISIAFVTTALIKIKHGWLSSSNLIVYNHLVVFSESYELKTFLSPILINFKSPIFWKFLDYFVVGFQLSFLINFYTIRLIIPQFILAFIFHLGILFTLNIAIFYPYMLLYLLIVLIEKERVFSLSKRYLALSLLFICMLAASFPNQLSHFFLNSVSAQVYLSFEFVLTIVIFSFGIILLLKNYRLLKADD